jgi:ABC-type glutathione transport system ATPase component
MMTDSSSHPAPVVDVRDLKVHFKVHRGLLGSQTVKAVDGVSFTIAPGETLGLAGESGSGKSTVARTLVRINRPTGGSVRLDGAEAGTLSGQDLRAYRRRMQMVYQDPYDSLDPKMTIADAVAEGLSVRGVPRSRRTAQVEELLARASCRAGSASGYRSPAPWRSTRRSSSATRRLPRLTCRSAPRCSTSSRTSRLTPG